MPYLVSIMPRAERDVAELYAAIHAEHSEAAFRWFRGLDRAFSTLENNPSRCPPTPESKNLRHLLYGNKPHIYRIVERKKEVQILHVRHGARKKFKPAEL